MEEKFYEDVTHLFENKLVNGDVVLSLIKFKNIGTIYGLVKNNQKYPTTYVEQGTEYGDNYTDSLKNLIKNKKKVWFTLYYKGYNIDTPYSSESMLKQLV